MSVEAMALVLHHSRAQGTDKLVLLGIANHCGDGGAWPTIETLARYANTTERTVQRSLRKLAELREVAVYQQAGGLAGVAAHQRPNRYEVTVSCPVECDRTANHRIKHRPSAPADLWITGVTPTSPGDSHVTGGVTPTSPGGVTPTSPKPSQEPTSTSGSQDSDHRQQHVAPCSICSLPYDQCVLREATSGHTYTPVPRSAAAVAARVRSHYSDALGDAS